jgi:hypothetical protein
MSPRRSANSESTVKAAEAKANEPDMTKVRKWPDVAKQVQAMREQGANVPEICEKLSISYPLVNQLILRSYKMVIQSAEVFERQEKIRLGIE